MPYDDPDPTDPMTLHGFAFETEDGTAMRDMAACFVEEYARLGFAPGRIMRMFRTRTYAGPFLAYQTLGDAEIRALVEANCSIRRPRTDGGSPVRETGRRVSLPVLDS